MTKHLLSICSLTVFEVTMNLFQSSHGNLIHKASFYFVLVYILIVFLLSRPVEPVKCYICEFNINYCKDPHCYTNPDICSANAFSSVLAPLQECPRNCMLKAVTNPAGIVLKWKRLCAPANDLTRGYQCRIDYIFGARIEQCTCDKEYCNASKKLQSLPLALGLSMLAIFSTSLILKL